MSDILLFIGSSLDLMLAITLIWLSSQMMIEKKIKPFLPFFFIGIAYIFASVFSFYFLITNILWFFKDLLLMVSIGYFVVNLKKYVHH
jgi:hypothetical protein